MSNIIYERFAEDKEIFCVHCIELNIPISGRSDLVMEKAEAAMNEHDSMLITCINDHLVIVWARWRHYIFNSNLQKIANRSFEYKNKDLH